MYTFVLMEYTDLRIPQDKIEQMLEVLIPRFEATYEGLPAEILTAGSPAKEKLLMVLERAGYNAGEDESGDIVINDCAVECLDDGDDPVLCALVGITPAGSYLTLYGDDNSQWQVRYDEARKWSVRGKVVFPGEERSFVKRSFPCEFRPGE